MTFSVCLILTVVWFVFMTYLSHQTGESTGRASRQLAESLWFLSDDAEALNMALRRFAHILVFAVLTVLLSRTVTLGNLPRWVLLLPVVLSFVDEATKPWIQGRHFSWFDVGLNLVGTAVGGLIFALLSRMF